ncbi:hypothetical protein XELAEV_18009228mg [Xenopus laevis]|uniref:Uncharacterized protein n=1 Tax=Xenopus laevis TaxID=8355 RepID=A0A974I089_XENLA|nr:hypothetical protein XELAEV_18009228mg [Xenopus laevis]
MISHNKLIAASGSDSPCATRAIPMPFAHWRARLLCSNLRQVASPHRVYMRTEKSAVQCRQLPAWEGFSVAAHPWPQVCCDFWQG